MYVNGTSKQNADSTYNLPIPFTVSGFHLQLRNPQQLNLTIQMSSCLFVDSTNCSGIRRNGCGFCKSAYCGAILSGTVF